jgi:hypothetical protein
MVAVVACPQAGRVCAVRACPQAVRRRDSAVAREVILAGGATSVEDQPASLTVGRRRRISGVRMRVPNVASAENVPSMTPQRFRLLQPLPPGRLGGAVRQPASTSRTLNSTFTKRVIGVHGGLGATAQRFHAPQPLPCGGLGGAAQLPVSTPNLPVFAGPQKGTLAINDAVRLDSRQPRTGMRIADSLQLPPRVDATILHSTSSLTNCCILNPPTDAAPELLQPIRRATLGC